MGGTDGRTAAQHAPRSDGAVQEAADAPARNVEAPRPDMGAILVPTATATPGVYQSSVRRHRESKKDRSAAAEGASFRPDVEGLRAIAIGLVLLFHAGLPFVTGGYVGVDVFFVISGYLITTQLVGELDRTGRISLPGFYGRRARRILPAAGVVLFATAVGVWLFVPRIRWEEIGGDLLASALYVVNWRLAARSVDYLAEDSQPSPVQHFWSLAVEEQFYLLWPVLMIVAALLARLLRVKVRPVVWLGIGAIAVPSLVWSIRATAYSPDEAFFSTATRMWELAIGAIIALAAGLLSRLPRTIATLVGWAGLAAVVASGFLFTTETAWPGYFAAVPTLGTAAVIAAGSGGTAGGPGIILGVRPMRWMGRMSYSLYLWHWPLIIIATAYRGHLGPKAGAVIVAASVVPAWISYKLIENPIRRAPSIARSPRLALSLGANFTLVGVAAGLLVSLVSARAAQPSTSTLPPGALGAAVLGDDPRDNASFALQDAAQFIVPDPLEATKDLPPVYADGCHQNQPDDAVLSCTYGSPDATTNIVLAGDSKAAQWLTALQLLGEQNDWRITVYTKSTCSLSSAMESNAGSPYTACAEWNKSLLDRLLTDRPDYVITSGDASTAIPQPGQPSDPHEAMVWGLRTTWQALTAAGIKVIVIADNPHPGFNAYECVDQHRQHLSECTFSSRRKLTNSAYPTQKEAIDELQDVPMVDLWDWICPAEECPAVIGNVLVYRQGSHLTATFVRTLAPQLAKALTVAGLEATQAGL